jgi:hypothetical protein
MIAFVIVFFFQVGSTRTASKLGHPLRQPSCNITSEQLRWSTT